MDYQGKADLVLKHLFLLTDEHDRQFSYEDVDVTVISQGHGRYHIHLPDLDNVRETTHICITVDGVDHFFENVSVNAREYGYLLSGRSAPSFPAGR